MNSKIARIFMVVSIVAILGAIGAYAWIGKPQNPMTLSEVTAMIQKTVPIGSSKAQVNTFLSSKGIGHSYFDETKEDFSGWSDVVLSGVAITQIGGITVATIPDTSRTFMMTSDMRIVFLFNRKGKLLKYTVKEIFTGP